MVSRNLTQEEITRLQAQGCSSTDWQRVKVASGFKTDYIQNVRFTGDIELGIFDYEFILEGGLPRHAGLFNVTLHNCRVGNNVLIENIPNYIANYRIGENCFIQNANLIVTPVDGTDEAALDTVKELAKQMGFGKIVTATPMWHDNMIAYTSQLAHVVSSSYVKDFCMDDALSFSGGSFQDMTRVARLDEDMWTELFLDDEDFLTAELEELIGHLTDYRNALRAKDTQRLHDLLKEGRELKATAGGN